MVKVSRVATAVAEVTAVAGIQSLAWKPAYAEAEAKKKKKKKKKNGVCKAENWGGGTKRGVGLNPWPKNRFLGRKGQKKKKKKKKKIIIFSYWKGEFFPLDLFLFNV